jgi:hypothetical protein
MIQPFVGLEETPRWKKALQEVKICSQLLPHNFAPFASSCVNLAGEGSKVLAVLGLSLQTRSTQELPAPLSAGAQRKQSKKERRMRRRNEKKKEKEEEEEGEREQQTSGRSVVVYVYWLGYVDCGVTGRISLDVADLHRDPAYIVQALPIRQMRYNSWISNKSKLITRAVNALSSPCTTAITTGTHSEQSSSSLSPASMDEPASFDSPYSGNRAETRSISVDAEEDEEEDDNLLGSSGSNVGDQDDDVTQSESASPTDSSASFGPLPVSPSYSRTPVYTVRRGNYGRAPPVVQDVRLADQLYLFSIFTPPSGNVEFCLLQQRVRVMLEALANLLYIPDPNSVSCLSIEKWAEAVKTALLKVPVYGPDDVARDSHSLHFLSRALASCSHQAQAMFASVVEIMTDHRLSYFTHPDVPCCLSPADVVRFSFQQKLNYVLLDQLNTHYGSKWQYEHLTEAAFDLVGRAVASHVMMALFEARLQRDQLGEFWIQELCGEDEQRCALDSAAWWEEQCTSAVQHLAKLEREVCEAGDANAGEQTEDRSEVSSTSARISTVQRIINKSKRGGGGSSSGFKRSIKQIVFGNRSKKRSSKE